MGLTSPAPHPVELSSSKILRGSLHLENYVAVGAPKSMNAFTLNECTRVKLATPTAIATLTGWRKIRC